MNIHTEGTYEYSDEAELSGCVYFIKHTHTHTHLVAAFSLVDIITSRFREI